MNIYKLSSDLNLEEMRYNCISIKDVEGVECSLYVKGAEDVSLPKWSWIVEDFSEDNDCIKTMKNPSALVKLTMGDDMFVISFGSGHFSLVKNIDFEFPKNFLKKIKISNIKNAGLSQPGTNQYKQIVMVKEASDFLLYSENAVEKVKVEITEEEKANLELKSKIIDIGNSINLKTDDSIEKCIQVIKNINNLLSTREDQRKISEYEIEKDEERKNTLLEKLKSGKFPLEIKLDDSQLYGTYYQFQDEYEIKIKYRNYEKVINDFELTSDLNYDLIDKYKLIFIKDEEKIFSKTLFSQLYVEIPDEDIILMNGTWYKYNSDYINYIDEYLDKNPIYINRDFNWKSEMNDVSTDMDNPYKEYKYNTYLSQNINGYKLMDRCSVDNTNLEPCDLYNEEKGELIYVKFGKATSGLSYNINQSNYILNSLGLQKEFALDNENYEIRKMTLIFILERRTELTEKTPGILDHRDFKMFGLKRDLVTWYNRVFNKNIIPEIIFAYKNI